LRLFLVLRLRLEPPNPILLLYADVPRTNVGVQYIELYLGLVNAPGSLEKIYLKTPFVTLSSLRSSLVLGSLIPVNVKVVILF